LAEWDEMAVVARIARAHGIRGQVILNAETDFPEERFQPGVELFVNRSGRAEPITVTTVRFQRERPVLGLSGIDDMNAATALAGLELRVPVDRLAALPANVYYRHDLVGSIVVTRAGRVVGSVTGVEGTMAGSRLVVSADGREVLVPLAADICTEIDPTSKRIVIDPPEGLLELNAKSG
jgi:16S rRNA processing protein RimM